jgi:hypothetical protein
MAITAGEVRKLKAHDVLRYADGALARVAATGWGGRRVELEAFAPNGPGCAHVERRVLELSGSRELFGSWDQEEVIQGVEVAWTSAGYRPRQGDRGVVRGKIHGLEGEFFVASASVPQRGDGWCVLQAGRKQARLPVSGGCLCADELLLVTCNGFVLAPEGVVAARDFGGEVVVGVDLGAGEDESVATTMQGGRAVEQRVEPAKRPSPFPQHDTAQRREVLGRFLDGRGFYRAWDNHEVAPALMRDVMHELGFHGARTGSPAELAAVLRRWLALQCACARCHGCLNAMQAQQPATWPSFAEELRLDARPLRMMQGPLAKRAHDRGHQIDKDDRPERAPATARTGAAQVPAAEPERPRPPPAVRESYRRLGEVCPDGFDRDAWHVAVAAWAESPGGKPIELAHGAALLADLIRTPGTDAHRQYMRALKPGARLDGPWCVRAPAIRAARPEWNMAARLHRG